MGIRLLCWLVLHLDNVVHRVGLVVGPGRWICDLHDALSSGRRYRDVRRDSRDPSVSTWTRGGFVRVDRSDVMQ